MKMKKIRKKLDRDLMEIDIIYRAVKSRWFQPALIWFNLFVFVILIMAGLVGTPMGNRNVAIMVIWIFWFFLLVVLLIPVGGRSWCMMCPLPAPGEWIQRRALVSKNGEPWSLGIEWPKRLDNIWMQNFGFLVVAAFSPMIFFYPLATVIVLFVFIVLAVIAGIVFTYRGRTGRIFCRYICPLGGFIGLYSLLGVLELKVKDEKICKARCQVCDKSSEEVCSECGFKACIKGSKNGYGCPWFLFPGGLKRNAYCGLCTECIKTCDYDNMTFKIRPFAGDLLKERHLDESYKAFIMLGSAFVYAIAYLAWFPELKDLSTIVMGSLLFGDWRIGRLFMFTLFLVGVCLVVLPSLHFAVSWTTQKLAYPKQSIKDVFVAYSYSYVPLGLAGWWGFMLYMMMINGSYLVALLSDPFGWGWNLFGTAGYSWRTYYAGLVPFLMLGIFLLGAAATTYTSWRISLRNLRGRKVALRATLPIVPLVSFITAVFVYVYVMS
ncbi:MAG: 4Fe-4S binding protein [Candidatus Hydrothermarchaeales archaeon]